MEEPLEATLLSEACASRINPRNSNPGVEVKEKGGVDRRNENVRLGRLHFLRPIYIRAVTLSAPSHPEFLHSFPLCSANKRPVKLFNERSAAADFLQRATHPLRDSFTHRRRLNGRARAYTPACYNGTHFALYYVGVR